MVSSEVLTKKKKLKKFQKSLVARLISFQQQQNKHPAKHQPYSSDNKNLHTQLDFQKLKRLKTINAITSRKKKP